MIEGCWASFYWWWIEPFSRICSKIRILQLSYNIMILAAPPASTSWTKVTLNPKVTIPKIPHHCLSSRRRKMIPKNKWNSICISKIIPPFHYLHTHQYSRTKSLGPAILPTFALSPISSSTASNFGCNANHTKGICEKQKYWGTKVSLILSKTKILIVFHQIFTSKILHL